MLSPDELKELCELCEAECIQFLSEEINHGISYGTKEATAPYETTKVLYNLVSRALQTKIIGGACN
jgi:hypothetical protein